MLLKSKTIFLRLATVDDAIFILSLRTDIKYNKHLSKVDENIKKQKEWLIQYKKKELLGLEYYFIICRKKDNKPIGTVRVYDFKDNLESFCWGSWILNQDKTRYSALESAVLIYDFAFKKLGFKNCHMDIRKENIKVIEFHKRFGVKIVGETKLDLLGTYSYKDYRKIRASIINIVNEYSEDD